MLLFSISMPPTVTFSANQGAPVHYEQTVREQVSRPGMTRRQGSVHGCTGTYEQTVGDDREEDAASVHGYTGTL